MQSGKDAVAARVFADRLVEKESGTPFPDDFSALGLRTRIGTLNENKQFRKIPSVTIQDDNWKKDLPSNLISFLAEFQKTGKAVSSTGEIQLDSRGDTIAIDTPRSQVLACSSDASGGLLRVQGVEHPQSFALISLDGAPLRSSKKMLFIHLANLVNTNMSFQNKSMTLLLGWGGLPLLVQKADVLVSIEMPDAKVQALNLDGSVNSHIRAAFHNGRLEFHANNHAIKGGTLCYLLTR